jgi:DeoR family transcriptional regulator of aga operon
MTRSPAQAERRRRELTELLSRDGDISTTEAARKLGVSAMTIRRDLKVLEDAGILVRRYGGAVARQRATFEFTFDERRRKRTEQKQRIGAEAARRVQPGWTVFLDTGTTTLEIARSLAAANIRCRVVTSSLVIASLLWGHPDIELVLVGGRVRHGSPDLVGPGTGLMLDMLTADIAFIGSDALHPERGSFAGDFDTADVAERMVANARTAVIVADSSKLGLAGPARYLRTEDIRELITDHGADQSAVTVLRRRGVSVTLV